MGGLPSIDRDSGPIRRQQPAGAATSASAVDEEGDSCVDVAAEIIERFPLVLAVPGAPITHLAELLFTASERHVWAVNEKSALEEAIGASLAGTAACIVVKHNGLNIAFDSLANAVLHTLGAALLVVVGDDPDATASTTATDSRCLAVTIDVPVLEPRLRGDARSVIETAAITSEAHHTPVIVRLTNTVHRRCRDAQGLERATREPSGKRDTGGVQSIAHELTKLGRVKHQRLVTRPNVRAGLPDSLSVVRCGCDGAAAVVRVGAAGGDLSRSPWCMFETAQAWPLPEKLLEFSDRHRQVLVLEDSAPLVESYLRRELRRDMRVVGRCTGHLPPEGALTREHVENAMAGSPECDWNTAKRKGDDLSTPTTHGALFEAVATLRREGVFVATDVGSSVRLCYPPYAGADAALSLGSSVSVAAGAASVGRLAIAVVGDYGLLHSGLQGVVEVSARRLNVLVIVLVNGTQHKTGGQPVPAVDLEKLLAGLAISVAWNDTWRSSSPTQIARDLRALLRKQRPATVLLRW